MYITRMRNILHTSMCFPGQASAQSGEKTPSLPAKYMHFNCSFYADVPLLQY